jgi:hypothetical protein
MISNTTLIEFGALLFDLLTIFYRHISLYYAIALSAGVTAVIYYMKTVLKL